VRSFRRNLASSRPPPRSSSAQQDGGARKEGGERGQNKGGTFVKINMDGVPIGLKVDLTAYGGYVELSAAVSKLFRGLLAGTSVTSPLAARLVATFLVSSRGNIDTLRSREGSDRPGGGCAGDRRHHGRRQQRVHAGIRGRGGRQGAGRRCPVGVSPNNRIDTNRAHRVSRALSASRSMFHRILTCPSAISAGCSWPPPRGSACS
jgi:hypothetical protein